MNPNFPDTAQILDEDLQIVHATLAVLLADIQDVSTEAGRAVQEAIAQLGTAHAAVRRLRANPA